MIRYIINHVYLPLAVSRHQSKNPVGHDTNGVFLVEGKSTAQSPVYTGINGRFSLHASNPNLPAPRQAFGVSGYRPSAGGYRPSTGSGAACRGTGAACRGTGAACRDAEVRRAVIEPPSTSGTVEMQSSRRTLSAKASDLPQAWKGVDSVF